MRAGSRLIRRMTVLMSAVLLLGAAGFVFHTRLPGPEPAVPAAQLRQEPDDPRAATPEEPVRLSLPMEPPAAEQVPLLTQADRILSRIPVLMYHEIGEKWNNNYISPGSFEAQMAWLDENGYHGVTLGAVYRHLFEGAPLPPKPVAITFDDGYRSFFTAAVPVLQQHRFTATSFVITSLVDHPEQMTWEQVVQLPRIGMEVGSHTVNHVDLRTLSGERLRREVAGSKQILEERLGVPVAFFCYPSGRYDEEAVAAVEAAGYKAGVTTALGWAAPDATPYLLSRVRISRTDTLAVFAKKVQSAAGY